MRREPRGLPTFAHSRCPIYFEPMLSRIEYHRRCLREWQQRFGQWRGARLWLWLQIQRMCRPTRYATLALPGLPSRVHLRSNGSDIACFEQIFVRRELGFDAPSKIDLVIDAGANIGLATVVLANRFPGAKVIALEVDAQNFRMLQMNTRDYPQVIALNKALWHADGFVKIENPSAAAWSFKVLETTADDPDAIPAVTVGSILRMVGRESVGLLKIDIEGAEFEMFSNAQSWLHTVQMLAVEIHEGIRPGVTALFESRIRAASRSCARHGEYEVLRFV
jgi:FkbM family methyltransferase